MCLCIYIQKLSWEPLIPHFQLYPPESFLFLLVLLLDFVVLVESELGGVFSVARQSTFSISLDPRSRKRFSYNIRESRVYMRRAREEIVEILAAAVCEDQYHHWLLKYSLLIMFSSVIVA